MTTITKLYQVIAHIGEDYMDGPIVGLYTTMDEAQQVITDAPAFVNRRDWGPGDEGYDGDDDYEPPMIQRPVTYSIQELYTGWTEREFLPNVTPDHCEHVWAYTDAVLFKGYDFKRNT